MAVHPTLAPRGLAGALVAVLAAPSLAQVAAEVPCEEQRLRPIFEVTNNSTEFGADVALQGDFVVAGAPKLDWVNAQTGSSIPRVGGAYVFRLDTSRPLGERWVMEDTLFHANPQVGDLFGQSVALDGTRVVVGCPADNHSGTSNAGSALVYSRAADGSWYLETVLRDTTPGADDFYGWTVAVQGDTVAVGSYLDDDASGAQMNTGSVFVYERDFVTGLWNLAAHVTAPDPGLNDSFGASVVLNGEYLAVGADFDDVGAILNAGSVYVFQRDLAGAWNPIQKLTASDAGSGFQFGRALDMQGDRLVVGASGWDQNPGDEYGAAYVFEDVGGAWIETGFITAHDGQPGDRFGRTVAVDGQRVAVGSLVAEKVYLYEGAGFSWDLLVDPLRSDNADSDALFGQAVALDGNRVLVGAPNDYFSGSPYALDTGTAYVFAPADVVTETFCQAKVSSLTQPDGTCLPAISAGGSRVPSVSAAEAFLITGHNIVVGDAPGPRAALGVLLWGTHGRRNLAYHGGSLCVQNQRIFRPRRFELLPPGAGNTCQGALSASLAELLESDPAVAHSIGVPVQAQWLFRDPGDPTWADGLTDAIEFVPCP